MDNIKQNISETNKITNKDEYIRNTAKKAIVKAAIALIVLVTTALFLTRDLSRSYIEEHSLVGTYALGDLLYDDDGNSYYDAVYEFESNGVVKRYYKYYSSFEHGSILYGNWSYNKFTDTYNLSVFYDTPSHEGIGRRRIMWVKKKGSALETDEGDLTKLY